MRSEDVVDLYQELTRNGVALWIDSGWAVDAAVGRQTRAHADLDIAVESKFVSQLRQILAQRGYRESTSVNAIDWNFILADHEGRRIDVHVVVLDELRGACADPLEGIAYPAGSLTGEGAIAGAFVRCVSAEALLRFKTSYAPRDCDRDDVAVLCALLGRRVPDTHIKGKQTPRCRDGGRC
ncbi:MAG: hypothetical protein K2Q06_09575 [Parvularculaceae bacterium]|nr:hypothetical protein [Parvularculaceae bacterium]